MTTTENPFAGQGPVLLDIGDDVGALIVEMPAEAEGLEVEIRPLGATAAKTVGAHEHASGQGHSHDNHHRHDHGESAFPHVAVVGRPAPAGVQYSLVYPAVVAGDYELCPIPGDAIILTTTIVGGQVTQA